MSNRSRIIYNTIVILLVLAGATMVILHFAHFGNVEFTDNAQVRQHITPVNTRVQGYVKEIRFDEYTPVHKGDTLVIIEDAEFKLRVAQAEADLINLQAGSKADNSGIATTSSNIKVTEAQRNAAKAQYENAKKEYERFKTLLAQKAVTQQQYDNVYTAYVSAEAQYNQVMQSLTSMALTKDQQGHRLEQTEAGIKVAEAALELARLNLSYTVITAPCDGVLSSKDIVEGQLMQPGQKVVDIIDNSEKWVIANYRETQFRHIGVGQEVKIKVDAVPSLKLSGKVESISEATGAALKNIPQDNATGNFVKVVQRIPVRISLSGNSEEALAKLRAGMNVECEVKY